MTKKKYLTKSVKGRDLNAKNTSQDVKRQQKELAKNEQ